MELLRRPDRAVGSPIVFKTVLSDWRKRIGSGRLRIALALVLVVGASVLFWASRDYTVVAPDWDGQVRGIAYNPSHVFTLKENGHITPEQIDRDMAQLSLLTGHVRTYTVAGGMDKVPEIARRYGLTVSLGCWISADLDQNETELNLCIKTALANRRVIDRVFVGNEAILFGVRHARPAQCLYQARARRAARRASRSPPRNPGRPGC